MIANNAAVQVADELLFENPVLNTTGATVSIASRNIEAYWGDTATLYTETATAAAVNTNTGAEGTLGFVKTGGNSRRIELHVFPAFTIDRNKYKKMLASVYVGHQSNVLLNRIAVRIGTSWYMRHTSVTQLNSGVVADADFAANCQQISFLIDDTTTSDWENLAFTPGTILSRNTAPIPLPSGNIEQIALAFTSGLTSNYVRWDYFRLTAKDVEKSITPLATPIAYQSEPVVVEETPSSVTATWTARMSKPATTNTPVRIQFTGASITEAYATILTGAYSATIQTIHTKGPAAFEVTGQVTTGAGYLTGANTVQKITVKPIMDLPEIRLKAWSDTDDMLLVEAVPELELVEWNDTTDTLKVKRKL